MYYEKENTLDCIKKHNMQAILGLLKIKNNKTNEDNKNFRIQKNEFQRNVLNEVFKLTKFPSKQTRDDLALLLNHTNRGIQIWFQNKRNSKYCKHNSLKKSIDKQLKTKHIEIDILTLIEIVEKMLPKDKKTFWTSFINYVPQKFLS